MEYWQKYNEKEEELDKDKIKSATGLHAWVGTYIKQHPWFSPTTNCFAMLSLGLLGFFSVFLGPLYTFLFTLDW